MIRMLTGLVFSFVLLACTSSKYYSKTNVELLEFEKQGKMLGIYYKVPLETMYYSSGVDYLYNDFGKLELKFVRAKIESHPKQMVKSFLTKDKSNNKKRYDLGIYYVEILEIVGGGKISIPIEIPVTLPVAPGQNKVNTEEAKSKDNGNKLNDKPAEGYTLRDIKQVTSKNMERLLEERIDLVKEIKKGIRKLT